MDAVYESRKKYRTISTLGPIIHNPQVVSELERAGDQGGRFAGGGKYRGGGHKVARMHAGGQTQACGKGNSDSGCDMSVCCKNTANSGRGVRGGEQVVIVGEANHPEVIGINGYCGNNAIIINNIDEAKKIPYTKKEAVFGSSNHNKSRKLANNR